jgi:hypothetical protein
VALELRCISPDIYYISFSDGMYTGTSKFPFRALRERTKLNRPAIVSYVDGQVDSMVQVGQERSKEMQ